MLPFILIFGIKIPLYGLCIVTGIFIAAFLCYWICKKKQQDFLNLILIGTIVVAAGFSGAKILYILVSYPLKDFFWILWSVLIGKNQQETVSGFVFYGGLILGIPAYFLAAKLAKCKSFEYLDIFSFIIPMVHGFGRIGCFCAGCCYGIPYEGIFAVQYKHPLSTVPVNVGIFPVQLIEAILLITLALILMFLVLKNKHNLIYIYIFSYSLIRFILEFFRYDSERGSVGILSVSQFISLILFLVTFIMFLFITKNKNKSLKKENFDVI